MAKYAIKVEQINDDGTRTPHPLGGGELTEITSDGFVILGITPDGEDGILSTVSVGKTCIAHVAAVMSEFDFLKQAASLALNNTPLSNLFRRENAKNATD